MLSNIGYVYGGRPSITPNIQIARVEEYTVLTPPSVEPITLEEAKSWLRIPDVITSEDAIILLLIAAVRTYFETYTNRILINTQFRHYGNCFTQVLEFSRGKRQTLDSFQYLKDGVFIDIPSDTYQILDEDFYWRIIFSIPANVPKDKDDDVDAYQGIRTDFVAGFGADPSFVPSDIKIALLNHVAAWYENRGDCDSAVCGDCSSSLPKVSKMVYEQYRHQSVFGAIYRGI